jgi:hypothetical protein
VVTVVLQSSCFIFFTFNWLLQSGCFNLETAEGCIGFVLFCFFNLITVVQLFVTFYCLKLDDVKMINF